MILNSRRNLLLPGSGLLSPGLVWWVRPVRQPATVGHIPADHGAPLLGPPRVGPSAQLMPKTGLRRFYGVQGHRLFLLPRHPIRLPR